MVGSESIKIDGAVRARIAGDSNAIGEDADFDGLPDLITTMIDGIDEGLFQCFIGVVEESLSLGFPTLLDDDLLDEDGIDIGKGLRDHAVQGAFEDFFGENVASRSVGKLNDVDLGLGKKRSGSSLKKSRPTLRGLSISPGPEMMCIWRQSWAKSIAFTSS